MRILYVSHSFPLPEEPLSNVGGMQRVAVELYRALRADPEVELSELLLETSWASTGRRTPLFLASLLARIPAIVRDKRIDAVLFSSMVTAAVTPLLHRRIRAAGAVTAAIPVGRDVTLPNPVYQLLVPRILRSLDFVLPISRATAEACLARGSRPERTHVVPCGVDFQRLEQLGATESRRARLRKLLSAQGHNIPDEAMLLLSVGRHQERKGFHWFNEEVVPKLRSDTIYLLAGVGPMTGSIGEIVAKRGLQQRVLLLGKVTEEELVTLYGGADLFIMPNIPVAGDIEGFGVVMLEAGAAGLPVVAADLEGIRDVVTSGENGTLVPPRDIAAFVSAIDAYRQPGVLRHASGRAAEFVQANFGWPAIARSYLQILRGQQSSTATV